jgi:hypothetical protein
VQLVQCACVAFEGSFFRVSLLQHFLQNKGEKLQMEIEFLALVFLDSQKKKPILKEKFTVFLSLHEFCSSFLSVEIRKKMETLT